MAIYIYIEFILLLLSKINVRAIVLLCLIGLILLSGFRGYTVGTDTYNYVIAYLHELKSVGSINEMGYSIYCSILRHLNVNSRGYLIVCAALFWIPLFYVSYKRSKYPLLAIFFIFSLGLSFYFFNIQRQMMAASLVVAAWHTLDVGVKKWVSILLLMLATSFHLSAIVMIVIFFTDKIKLSPATISILLISSYIIPFILPLQSVLLLLSNLLSFFSTDYSRYIENAIETSVFSWNRLFMNFLMISLALSSKNDVKKSSFKLIFLGITWLNLFPQVVMAKRIGEFFLFFQPFYFEEKFRCSDLISKAMIIVYSISVFYFFITINIGEIVPYEFGID